MGELPSRRATVVDVDGDDCIDASLNALRVTSVGGGGSGTSQADKSTFTEGTSGFTPTGGVFNDTLVGDVAEDQAAAQRITRRRAGHVNLRNNDGIEVGTAAAPIRIDPTGVTAQNVNVLTMPSGALQVSKQISASLTRPADTTAYAAGDAVTNSTTVPVAITFQNCARANAGSGRLIGATMVDSANQATKGIFELWVFTALPTPDNDNAAFTPTDAECATLVGIIPLNATFVGDATAGAGGNCVYEAAPSDFPFTCGVGVDDLYGLMVVRNAYTPVSAETFTFILRLLQD